MQIFNKVLYYNYLGLRKEGYVGGEGRGALRDSVPNQLKQVNTFYISISVSIVKYISVLSTLFYFF